MTLLGAATKSGQRRCRLLPSLLLKVAEYCCYELLESVDAVAAAYCCYAVVDIDAVAAAHCCYAVVVEAAAAR